MANYLQEMDERIRKMRDEKKLTGIRFCTSGKPGEDHQNRMAEIFCLMARLEDRLEGLGYMDKPINCYAL